MEPAAVRIRRRLEEFSKTTGIPMKNIAIFVRRYIEYYEEIRKKVHGLRLEDAFVPIADELALVKVVQELHEQALFAVMEKVEGRKEK